MLNKIRLWIIKKLLKETDGYVYIGLEDNEPINFYYDENINEYVLGKRCGNYYYNRICLYGIHANMSKNLVWDDMLKQPKLVPFMEWLRGVIRQLNDEHWKEIKKIKVKQL